MVCKTCTRDLYLFKPMMARIAELETQVNELASRQTIGEQADELVELGAQRVASGKDFDATLAVTDAIRVTTSQDILTAMARGDGPKRALVALGYAGATAFSRAFRRWSGTSPSRWRVTQPRG